MCPKNRVRYSSSQSVLILCGNDYHVRVSVAFVGFVDLFIRHFHALDFKFQIRIKTQVFCAGSLFQEQDVY